MKHSMQEQTWPFVAPILILLAQLLSAKQQDRLLFHPRVYSLVTSNEFPQADEYVAITATYSTEAGSTIDTDWFIASHSLCGGDLDSCNITVFHGHYGLGSNDWNEDSPKDYSLWKFSVYSEASREPTLKSNRTQTLRYQNDETVDPVLRVTFTVTVTDATTSKRESASQRIHILSFAENVPSISVYASPMDAKPVQQLDALIPNLFAFDRPLYFGCSVTSAIAVAKTGVFVAAVDANEISQDLRLAQMDELGIANMSDRKLDDFQIRTYEKRYEPFIATELQHYKSVKCTVDYKMPSGVSPVTKEVTCPIEVLKLPETSLKKGADFGLEVRNGNTGERMETSGVAFEGDDVLMRCLIKYDAPNVIPNIVHFSGSERDLQIALTCANANETSHNRTLIPYSGGVVGIQMSILGVTASDSGHYRCCRIFPRDISALSAWEASVQIMKQRTARDDAKLLVSKGTTPAIEGPATVLRQVTALDLLDLPCEVVQGNPQPEFLWLKGDKSVSASDITRIPNGTSLRIANASLSDSGTYTCIASNRFGTATKLYRVAVLSDGAISIPIASVVVPTIATIVIVIAVFVHGNRQQSRRLRELQEMFDAIWHNLEVSEQSRCVATSQPSASQQLTSLRFGDTIELPSSAKLRIFSQLGRGHYSEVCEGRLDQKLVAVKMPRRRDEVEQYKALVAEIVIMCQIRGHENVLCILGTETRSVSQGRLYLISEYCHHGSLLGVLRRARKYFPDGGNPSGGGNSTRVSDTAGSFVDQSDDVLTSDSGAAPTRATENSGFIHFLKRFAPEAKTTGARHIPEERIEWSNLQTFATDIAKGLSFLRSRNIIHRDLAARNILVAKNFVAKIADFGLSKSADDYVIKTSKRPPIRWLAVESILDNVFTHKTDVWSYGVVLWEVFTLGRKPYDTLPPGTNLAAYILAGNRLERPQYAAAEIYGLMSACWNADPESRPNIAECVDLFGTTP